MSNTLPVWLVAGVSLAYLLGLFALAYGADRRAAAGKAVGGPVVYALSLAVYCTAWTFYGSVGRAAEAGVGFLPTYLGPTLVMALAPLLLAKILRVARRQRSTSIADFIAARYGRSQALGGLVACVAVVGLVPYIALQLKAMSAGFELLTGGAAPGGLADTGLWIALLMALFAIIFGTRSIDATEHHPGLVTAIAFEAVVKLVAFLLVGAAVVWGLAGGPGALLERAAEVPRTAGLLTGAPALEGGAWVTGLLLAMAATLCLPRQFQVMVVENTDERHLHTAQWLFPLYLLLINLFVLPLALAGLLLLPAGNVPADMFVLGLPLAAGWEGLALLAFIGGLSAGTGMIIVETVALATMVSNDLVLPLLFRGKGALEGVRDLGRLTLMVRRAAIVGLMLLGALYVQAAGGTAGLVSIGLVSFAAVAQFAPALLGGLFWIGGTRQGAIAGIAGGTLVWAYTLLLPSLVPESRLVLAGPWGIGALRPEALFGVQGLSPLAHSLFWSLVANVGLYLGLSVLGPEDEGSRAQGPAFVEALGDGEEEPGDWRGTATVAELEGLLARFLGPGRAWLAGPGESCPPPQALADAGLVRRAERLLAGAIGAASARVALASVLGGGAVGRATILRMLDETSGVIEYSRRLERKSAELEAATAALSAANDRLRELDRMKDEFLSTITHELRTPLTSVRALSEILYDTPDLPEEQRQEFLGTIIKESERLTRLINQVLDMAKIEAGALDWSIGPVDLARIARDAADATQALYRERGVALELSVPPALPLVLGDADRLAQVVLNLLSNAVKFVPQGSGRVVLSVERDGDGMLRLSVADNGPGIPPEYQEEVFDRFRQVSDAQAGKPQGTGLGLAICRRLVEHMGGRIWVESLPGQGATFRFTVPLAPTP
ncbi:ATP-binding protein [Aerophototrophica crusticola]|uniref:ATP-binding protein n=1 Tax=Aerophototrophica crusticola TaxID=1709002 RepID=UPI000A46E292